MTVYVTFGQVHTHRVNGKTFDCDSVAVVHGDRRTAFDLFGDKFHQCLEEKPDAEFMSYFPRGLIAANSDRDAECKTPDLCKREQSCHRRTTTANLSNENAE